MGLKDAVLRAQAAQTGVSTSLAPVIGPQYAQYLSMPETERPGAPGGPPWSDAALEHRRAVEAGEFKHVRSGRYSPSSITKCQRRVMFGFLGAPEAPREDLELENMAGFGNMRHLYHQMVGITMGYLEAGEVWTQHPTFTTGGSMDGTGRATASYPSCGIFELKSVASTKYQRIVTVDREILFDHRMQMANYALCSGIETGSVVYEDRNYGNFFEFRWERNDRDEQSLIELLKTLRGFTDAGDLPEILSDCSRRVGQLYRDCSYADHCLKQATSARG